MLEKLEAQHNSVYRAQRNAMTATDRDLKVEPIGFSAADVADMSLAAPAEPGTQQRYLT